MNFKRFYAILKARNIEFTRDRAALGWNFAFPILLVVGFALMFSGDGKALYNVGVMGSQQSVFTDTRFIQFVEYQRQGQETDDAASVSGMAKPAKPAKPLLPAKPSMERAMLKLRQHSLDLLIDKDQRVYWVNENSHNGYIVEKLLLQVEPNYSRKVATGQQIRYVDWVLPGILGMNMMFSCIFGVGYVVVRYRKNSVLKRLQATPLNASEFIFAQVISRLIISLVVAIIVYVGCNLVFDFYMIGSYLALLIITGLGALALISLGLIVASRSQSEELVGGLLNMVSWPMMMLSGVWFSLEGSPQFVQDIAQFLPLTHLVEAARAIMINGDSLWDVKYNVICLAVMTVLFTAIGAAMFRWDSDAR
ncbi:MAG: ABC-2 type transport system permease protein [Phenylobacterium sp.]|jgi:ABC-2 type transport system permease protein